MSPPCDDDTRSSHLKKSRTFSHEARVMPPSRFAFKLSHRGVIVSAVQLSCVSGSLSDHSMKRSRYSPLSPPDASCTAAMKLNQPSCELRSSSVAGPPLYGVASSICLKTSTAIGSSKPSARLTFDLF